MVTAKHDDVDIGELTSLYKDDKTVRAFLDYAARRQRNATETTVNRMMTNLAQEGHAASRQEIVTSLKKLADIGCADFIVGRHGKQSRFRWKVGLVSLGRAASGESEKIEKITDSNDGLDETGNMLTHSFHLRPSVVIEIDLPADLTESEANRLADYIKTLPFRG